MAEIYLVRHGQSVGNEQKLFFGWSDHPLTDLGRDTLEQEYRRLCRQVADGAAVFGEEGDP